MTLATVVMITGRWSQRSQLLLLLLHGHQHHHQRYSQHASRSTSALVPCGHARCCDNREDIRQFQSYQVVHYVARQSRCRVCPVRCIAAIDRRSNSATRIYTMFLLCYHDILDTKPLPQQSFSRISHVHVVYHGHSTVCPTRRCPTRVCRASCREIYRCRQAVTRRRTRRPVPRVCACPGASPRQQVSADDVNRV